MSLRDARNTEQRALVGDVILFILFISTSQLHWQVGGLAVAEAEVVTAAARQGGGDGGAAAEARQPEAGTQEGREAQARGMGLWDVSCACGAASENIERQKGHSLVFNCN